jgi:uridylate kinase
MKTILLKLSGELFKGSNTLGNICMNAELVKNLAKHIKKLRKDHQISIVIGGGNFFRGQKEGAHLGLKRPTADAVGMLATIMNGLMLRDFFEKEGIACTVLDARGIPGVISPIEQTMLDQAVASKSVIIFTGGTGNPFFSTDTAAVVRALQVGATEIWKASTVDYVYDADPAKNTKAKPIKKACYTDMVKRKLKVMDLTAMTLAQEHALTIRVFNIFTPNALLKAASDADFGSTISE